MSKELKDTSVAVGGGQSKKLQKYRIHLLITHQTKNKNSEQKIYIFDFHDYNCFYRNKFFEVCPTSFVYGIRIESISLSSILGYTSYKEKIIPMGENGTYAIFKKKYHETMIQFCKIQKTESIYGKDDPSQIRNKSRCSYQISIDFAWDIEDYKIDLKIDKNSKKGNLIIFNKQDFYQYEIDIDYDQYTHFLPTYGAIKGVKKVLELKLAPPLESSKLEMYSTHFSSKTHSILISDNSNNTTTLQIISVEDKSFKNIVLDIPAKDIKFLKIISSIDTVIEIVYISGLKFHRVEYFMYKIWYNEYMSTNKTSFSTDSVKNCSLQIIDPNSDSEDNFDSYFIPFKYLRDLTDFILDGSIENITFEAYSGSIVEYRIHPSLKEINSLTVNATIGPNKIEQRVDKFEIIYPDIIRDPNCDDTEVISYITINPNVYYLDGNFILGTDGKFRFQVLRIEIPIHTIYWIATFNIYSELLNQNNIELNNFPDFQDCLVSDDYFMFAFIRFIGDESDPIKKQMKFINIQENNLVNKTQEEIEIDTSEFPKNGKDVQKTIIIAVMYKPRNSTQFKRKYIIAQKSNNIQFNQLELKRGNNKILLIATDSIGQIYQQIFPVDIQSLLKMDYLEPQFAFNHITRIRLTPNAIIIPSNNKGYSFINIFETQSTKLLNFNLTMFEVRDTGLSLKNVEVKRGKINQVCYMNDNLFFYYQTNVNSLQFHSIQVNQNSEVMTNYTFNDIYPDSRVLLVECDPRSQSVFVFFT